jgi:CheY-like chemotaxis protein
MLKGAKSADDQILESVRFRVNGRSSGQAWRRIGYGKARRSHAPDVAKAGDTLPSARFRCDGGFMALILIVEDEVFIRQSAEWTMEDLGHSTLVASDLDEAIVHLSASASIDAVFVDMRLNALPFGGYEVANRAIALQPHLRVLYTSGTPLTADVADRFVPGGQFIQKPYSPEQLGASMEQLLN